MLNKINKIISILLTIIFIVGIFPPVIFAEPNQASLGEVKGFNRAVIDSHFSRADRETNPDRWLAEARFGITQAICAWELIAGNLYDNPLLYENAKAQIAKWSDEELEKRFSQWLMGRFFGKAAEEALINLSSMFNESQKNYSWHLDENGNVIFDDKTGDPLVIRPNEEGREFSVDLALWRNESNEIVKTTNAELNNSMLHLYPELLAYIPAESRESMYAVISESLNVQRNVIKQEFENIAAREERIFTNRRTRDIWSLRKKSEDEAAKIFTEKLIAETDASCKKGIEELNAKIEQASAGAGDLAILGEEWLRLYKEQFERGLKAWEDAEERFFIRRIEWEQDTYKLFSEGENIWLSAFNQFEEERQKWELSAKELFQAGETLFKKISEDFEKTIADARKEFELNIAVRTGEATNKVKALIDIYLLCASTAISSMDNVKFWQNQYGNSEKDIKDTDFSDWISQEIQKSKDSKFKLEALTEMRNSYNTYLSYLKKSLDARNEIYKNYAELFGSGVLKDILSSDVSSDDFYLDEYQIALLRAKALVLYWERKTSIADAVTSYAKELSAGRMTEAEGIRAWEEAKSAYNESLNIYEAELSKLNTIGEDVQKQQKILYNLSVQLQIEEDKLNKLYSEHSSLLSMSAVSLKDFYSTEFNEKYNYLVEKYQNYMEKGNKSVYFSALEYGMLWDIKEQRESEELIKNILENDDKLSEEEKTYLYNILNELNSDFQKELWQNTCDSLSILFKNYGIETEKNIFPDVKILCKGIFVKQGDFAENTAQFLLDFDNCFSTVPAWLQYEIDNWKKAVIEYIAAYSFSNDIQPDKNLTKLTQLNNMLFDDYFNLINYVNTRGYIDDKEIQQINNAFSNISNELTKIDYMYKISEIWEQINLTASTENEKHWRQYLINDYITNKNQDFLMVSSWKEGILADALLNASYYTNRINDSFNLYSEKDNYNSNADSKQLYTLYNEEINRIQLDFNLLNSFKNEIIIASKAYEISKQPTATIQKQLSALEEEIKKQEKIVTPLKDQYLKEAGIFINIGSQYDNQYNILKTAQNNTDQKRFEYEKQDAIQRWASTSYINTDNIDSDNCKANLLKAQDFLKVLSDISNNENRITYKNSEYEALYAAYEQSFTNKLKTLEAFETLSSAYTQEKIYNEEIYTKYHDSLFQLGINFDYKNYQLPSSRSSWKIENIITVQDGRLAFSRNNMYLSGVDAAEAESVAEYFSPTKSIDGEQFSISAYEEALRGLSQRMSDYFKDQNKFIIWSYARNYLISSLIYYNNDLSFLKNYFSFQGEFYNNSPIASVYIKPDPNKKNKTLLSYMEDNFFNINAYQTFQAAWNSLNSNEKADLEFYVILTLTSNNDYFAGFKEVYPYHAYKYALEKIYSFIQEEQDVLDTGYRFLEWSANREAKDINTQALLRILPLYTASNNQVLTWINGLQNNLKSINNLSSLYVSSCKKLNDFEGTRTEDKKITWIDLEKALSLSKIKSDDIAVLKTCWEKMLKNNSDTAYQNVFEALTGLFHWTDEQTYLAKNNLDTRLIADMQKNQINEEAFLSIVDDYFNGTADIKKVKAAAENAYGNNSISLKYFLDNMYGITFNNLSMYTDVNHNLYSLFSNKGEELISLTENIIKNKYNAEFTAREEEWALTKKDLAEKYDEWQKTAVLILENGRTDWAESYKKLQDAYKQWNVNFQSEYERVSNEWAYAYLAGLEDKEKWLQQAADAVNQASSEAFLSLVGAEGERLSKFMDTREPFGIRDAVPEAQAIMTSLLQSSGIVNMANAFSSLNNYTGIASPLVKRGIGGSSSWDSAIVKASASAFAKEANDTIAKSESKKLAYSARKSADEAIKGLTDNVNTANQSFRENMDNVFSKGLWRKNGNNYVKDIIKGSTVSTPVITQTVNIAGYRNYNMEPIKLRTNLDDNFLSGLDTIAIQGLINNVYAEVQTIAGDIFGNNQKPIPINKNGVKREQSPGKFGEHIGYSPANVQLSEATKDRNKMFYDEGTGEVGRLLADYQYWYAVDKIGNSELALAPWEKRMWDDDGSWFTAPSIRTAGLVSCAIAAAIVTSVCTYGAGAPAAIAGGIALSAAICSASEITLGALDVAYKYKPIDEVAVSVGKTVVTNTVTSAIGGAFSGASAAAGSVIAKTLIAGAQTASSGIASNLISGITYTSEGSFGYSKDILISGLKSTLNGSLTSMASAFVSSGLTSINSGINNSKTGLDYTKLKGFSNLDQANLQKFNNLAGSLAGQGLNYALGNDFTLNVLNLSLFTNNEKINSGLLELHLGRDGVSMSIGTGGANVSIDNLVAAYKGAQVWNVNTKISNYGKENNFDALISLRLQYGYGDDRQKEQLWDILNGEALINTKAEGDYFAETTIDEDGKRVINLANYKNGMSEADQFLLGVVFGYEAYRDGYTIGQTDASGVKVTYAAQSEEFQNAQIAKLLMGDRIQAENNWFYEKFETLATESALLKIAQLTNNMSLFNDYMELIYDNSKDYLCIPTATGGDYQNYYSSVLLFNSVYKNTEKEAKINEQRFQEAFDKYNAKENPNGNNDASKALYSAFLKDEKLQKEYGYSAISTTTISDAGCMFMAAKYAIEGFTGTQVNTLGLHEFIKENGLFADDNILSRWLLADIMTKYTNNEYIVKYMDKFGEKPTIETLNKIESPDDKYVIHLRIKDPSKANAVIHSVTVSSIEYTYDDNGSISGIKQVNVANPYNNTNHFNGRSSYLPSEIVRWDIYNVTENKK